MSGNSCSRRLARSAHDHLVKLFHLFPRCGDRAFLPSAVAAHRGTPEEDAAIGFAQCRESIGGAAATTAAPGKRAEAVWRLLPERAVSGLDLCAHLRMDLADVRQHVLDTFFDRH